MEGAREGREREGGRGERERGRGEREGREREGGRGEREGERLAFLSSMFQCK